MPKLTRKGTVSRDIVRPEYAKKYGYRRHNGDDISTAMAEYCGSGTGFELPKMVKVAADNDLADKLQEWGDQRGKSNGMLRMLLGAQLRKRKHAGIDIVIGDLVIPGELVEKAVKVYVPKVKEPRKSIAELLADLNAQPPAEEPDEPPSAPSGEIGETLPQPELRRGKGRERVERVEPVWSASELEQQQRAAGLQTRRNRTDRTRTLRDRATWSREDIPTQKP